MIPAKLCLPRPVRQGGFNLVELMVALVIGLVVSLVATVAYITGIETQSAQNDMAREDEAARFAMMLLTAELGKAGFRNTDGNFPGLRFGSAQGAVVPLTFPVDGIDGTSVDNNFSDTLIVTFYGENDFASPALNTADGRILDCLGNAVQRNTRVVERLYVANDAANADEPSLFCKPFYFVGVGAAAPVCATEANADGSVSCPEVPLIPGVEVMKLVYGEDTDDDGVANRYVTVGRVINKEQVLNVKPALIVRTTGSANINPDNAAKTIDLLGASFVPAGTDKGFAFAVPADGRYHFPYSTTIALRNIGQVVKKIKEGTAPS
jgi:type IV pilus assembly protein PilW